MVARLRPFGAPAPPVPIDQQTKTEKRRSPSAILRQEQQEQQHQEIELDRRERTYKATLIVHETTDSNGDRVWSAQTSKAIEITDSPQQMREIREPVHGFKEIEPRSQRQMSYGEQIRERRRGIRDANGEKDEMLAISVKRQRKLKMKKHKYKKLMKRTRNLRRRIERQ